VTDETQEAVDRGLDTDEAVRPRELPASVRISVWTRAQRNPVKSGVAYVHFFPQGTAERAMIFVTQGDNSWTIDVSPLTGRARVLPDIQEVPRS
jgi:general secretion pathway protein H